MLLEMVQHSYSESIKEETKKIRFAMEWIPVEDDPKWRFWKMYEDETVSWSLTDEEKEYIKSQTTAYCLNSGYLYLTEKQYFVI